MLAALARLAGHVVGELSGLTVVGVTGSSGKTSTKDLLAAVLAPLGPTVAPPESFNNELGLPWTALRADADTRHLVLEFSARGTGHIAALAAAVPPRIGVVLNVGCAHLGEFGSVDAIARAKGELVEALPSNGVAVLNADDPRVAAMAPRTTARVLTFGVRRPTCAPKTSPSTRAAPVSASSRPRGARRWRCGSSAPTTSATRWPRPRWRASWAAPRRPWRRRSRPPRPRPGGGWR